MGTLARRLARLEQQAGGEHGAGVTGFRCVHWERQTGPDVVQVSGTGERLTEAEFRARYPKGVLFYRLHYGDDAPAVAGW